MEQQQKTNGVTPLNAIIVFIITMGLSIILAGILGLTVGLGLALVVSELLLLFIPLGFLLITRVDIKSYVRFYLKPKYILLGAGFAIILLVINGLSVYLLTMALGTSVAVEEANRLLMELSKSPEGLTAIVAALSLAGICEEFLFRGFLQNSLSRRFTFIPAVIISSVTFGLFHFDPQLVYIISTIIAGLILGYIYHRWQSLVVSMTAHSVMNIIVLVTLLLSI